MKIEVARLSEIEVRQVWPGEEKDFTPWLSENLDVLESELGLGLELDGIEYKIGKYELDLLLTSYDDRVVVVENQFGTSDHKHLGQVLAYAAGTEAHIVVWIAERFTDEHAAALRWLNDSSIEGIDFFAIVLKVVRIGQSAAAPMLESVIRPNEWVRKAVKATYQAGDWEEYVDNLGLPAPKIAIAKEIVRRLKELAPDWETRFNRGYVRLYRSDRKAWIAVGASTNHIVVRGCGKPQADPYPHLESKPFKDGWRWVISNADEIPKDLEPLVKLTKSVAAE
jgi:hypothetical protein